MFLLRLFVIRSCLVVTAVAPKLNLKQTMPTVFSSLTNYHVNGQPATETTYPWIAQVVHSRSRNVPYMCTATCVHEGVFMTAARCIFNLKVKYTSVIYKSKRLPARAFVVPSKPTSQQFDDIGFIVIDSKGDITYNVAALYPQNKVKRKDEAFKWFNKSNITGPFKVIGYAADKGTHKLRSAEIKYWLKELPVHVGLDICYTILTNNHVIDGFQVPCYHSCTVTEFYTNRNSRDCQSYLGVEGAVIMHAKSKKILGVAIWGPFYFHYELPVGFSVVYSPAFLEDLACAKKIRGSNAKSGFQSLCKK